MRPNPEDFASAYLAGISKRQQLDGESSSHDSYRTPGRGLPFASTLGSTTPPPTSGERAFSPASAASSGQETLSRGLDAVYGNLGNMSDIGYQGASAAQGLRHGKELSRLGAQGAQQSSMFQTLNSGIGALGSIGSSWKRADLARQQATRQAAGAT